MKFTLPKFERPERPPKPPLNPRLMLIHICAFVTGCAALTEWVWAILFCIEATGKIGWRVDWANGNGGQPAVWVWGADFVANIPVLAALLLATVPIVLWSMIWLPFYQQARGTGKSRRFTMAAAGVLANALVILSGTIVMNGNRQEHVRAQLVVEQSAAQAQAGLRATAEAKKVELDDIAVPASVRPTYQQQACRVGARSWSERVKTARAQADFQLPAIERALSDAQHCDQLREEYRLALATVYTAPVAAASASEVKDSYGAGMNAFAQYAQVYRPPFVALICTLIGIWGAWWLVGVWAQETDRERQPAPEAMMVEDKSSLPIEEPAPLVPPVKRGQYFDEDGNRIVRRKETWAKVGKRSKRAGDETEYDAPAPVSAADPRVAANAADAAEEDQRATDTARAEGADGVESGDVYASPESVDRRDAVDLADSEPAGHQVLHSPAGRVEGETLNAPPQENPADQGNEEGGRNDLRMPADDVGKGDEGRSVAADDAQPQPQPLAPETLQALIDEGKIAELSDEPGVFVEVQQAEGEDYGAIADKFGITHQPEVYGPPARETEAA